MRAKFLGPKHRVLQNCMYLVGSWGYGRDVYRYTYTCLQYLPMDMHGIYTLQSLKLYVEAHG